MDVPFGLGKIDARIKRLERWKMVLAEMANDAEGREVIRELAASLNGRERPVTLDQRRLPIPHTVQTKKSKLDAAISETMNELGRPFSTRELMEILQGRGFEFSRKDPMVEMGSAMRRLLGDGKVKIAQEKEGSVGRLYERILA